MPGLGGLTQRLLWMAESETQQAGAKTGSGFHTILTSAYENAFITNNYGYSSAISMIIFVLLLVLSARYQMREEGDR